MEICAMILAGGRTAQFWPWSNELLPKPFLPLAHSEKTLLQQTVERILPLVSKEKILILTNRENVPIVRTQLPDHDPSLIIGEPSVKSTAAAITLGSAVAAKLWPSAVQVVLPADHDIAPDIRFREVVAYAAECANGDGKLYTIGIRPMNASPDFGYLQRSRLMEADRGFVRSNVAAFIEKPDMQMAQTYLESGLYFWNSGIYIWRPEEICAAIERRLPEHGQLLQKAAASFRENGFETVMEAGFQALPKVSIDYGLMQKEGQTGNVRVVEGDFHWSDMGGWWAFFKKLRPDENGNRTYGHSGNWLADEKRFSERWQPRQPKEKDTDESLVLGEVATFEASDNFIFNNRQGHRVVLFGVNNLTVMHTHRTTLVMPKNKLDKLHKLLANLPEMVRVGGFLEPKKIEKPWGYELWWGWTEDFAGKTLFLRKGKRFSLQYHVVKEEVIFVHEGQVSIETAKRGAPLERRTMKAGDAILVEPGRLHRIEAIEDSLLFESSLPFLWDVIRVADDFGREGTSQAEINSEKETKR